MGIVLTHPLLIISLLPICTVNILHNRGVAFVSYATEHQAEFAKEAMANQSMDGDEIMNVR